jgi:hypothetical protein
VFALCLKGISAKDIHEEIFLVYGWKCLSRKGIDNWVEKYGKSFIDDEEVEPEARKWLRQQSKTYMLRVSKHW